MYQPIMAASAAFDLDEISRLEISDPRRIEGHHRYALRVYGSFSYCLPAARHVNVRITTGGGPSWQMSDPFIFHFRNGGWDFASDHDHLRYQYARCAMRPSL